MTPTLSNSQLEAYFDWLAESEKQVKWSQEEKAALHVMSALNMRDSPGTLVCLARAIEETTPGAIPLASQLGERLFELARNAYRKNRTSADIETSLTLALRTNYQPASAHASLGEYFELKNQFDRALEHYAAASKLEPGDPAHLINLANLCRSKRQFIDAAGWVENALSIRKNYAWAHNQRGLIARDQKDYEQATAAFEEAHKLDPKEPSFANNLAENYRLQKQYGKANEWVEKALAVQSDYARAHNRRGLIARDQKDYERTTAAFEEAHKLDPKEPSFAINLADTYRLQKQYDKANEWVEKALAVQSDYAWAHNQRGLIAQDQKDYEQATAAFEEAHKLDPKEPSFAINLANTYRLQKQYDKANEWVEKTLAVQSDYSWAHNQRGLIARDQKDYARAAAAFEQAHKLDPKEPSFAINLADTYRLQKQHDKANEWVEKALAVQSDYSLAHERRGLIAQDQKDYERATAAFEEAHKLDPKEPSFAINLADTYRLQKQYDKANEWVEKALAVQSDYAWAQ